MPLDGHRIAANTKAAKITEVLRRQSGEAYHWKMSGKNPEYPDSGSPDPLIHVLVRDEPDDEEDEEEDDGDGREDGDDDEDDGGYSE